MLQNKRWTYLETDEEEEKSYKSKLMNKYLPSRKHYFIVYKKFYIIERKKSIDFN